MKIVNVKSSCGVLVDMQGDTLVCEVHPIAQLLVIVLFLGFYFLGVWAGSKPDNSKKGGRK